LSFLCTYLVLCAGPTVAEPAKPAPAKVELKTINYAQLVEAVKAHRGKVVVVDVWGDFCVPCKKEFPHLVEMQRKYNGEGLVCISVCIATSDDDLKTDEPKALKFLTAQNAVFQNYLLEDGWKVCESKWKIKGVPATFVFDRDGMRARRFTNDDPDNQYDLKDVEKLVTELLRPKK
jgi:thiol-disulfide isomerase/thioredoxin